MVRVLSRMKLAKYPVFLHNFNKFTGILLFVLKYMYISLLLKMIDGFSWPAKIMANPSNFVFQNWCRYGMHQGGYVFKIEVAHAWKDFK